MRCVARLLAIAPALVAAGCFPYHQTYRPAIAGVVVDRARRPVPGAEVVACTTDGWEAAVGCPRRGEAWTGPDGRFQLAAVRELEWCCFGEAPLPKTLVTACANDDSRRRLVAPPSGLGAGGDLILEVAPPEHPTSADCTPLPGR